MQNKRTFASRFFELFTSPGSLKLNTQRRSAASLCAFEEEELCQLLASRSECKWRVQPCDSYLKERFIFFIVCLFILFYYYFFAIHISRFFSSYFFCYPHFFFVHPHFSIRIFPSASAIRRYPVRVLQTPVPNVLMLAKVWFCQRFSFVIGLTYLSGLKVSTSSSTWLRQTA